MGIRAEGLSSASAVNAAFRCCSLNQGRVSKRGRPPLCRSGCRLSLGPSALLPCAGPCRPAGWTPEALHCAVALLAPHMRRAQAVLASPAMSQLHAAATFSDLVNAAAEAAVDVAAAVAHVRGQSRVAFIGEVRRRPGWEWGFENKPNGAWELVAFLLHQAAWSYAA